MTAVEVLKREWAASTAAARKLTMAEKYALWLARRQAQEATA